MSKYFTKYLTRILTIDTLSEVYFFSKMIMPRKREADQGEIRKILLDRGYKDGKPPRGYEAHHIRPLVEGGKDTPKNIRVIRNTKHKQIHENRRGLGNI